ncbi:hypothetical protein ACS0TY_008597 [Phlomoides rotata]
MPPAQSPGYAPRSVNYYPPTGNGIHKLTGSHSRTSPAKKVVIVVLLCITCVVIASILMFCFIRRRHSAKEGLINTECNQYVEKFLLQHGSLAPKRYKYSEFKKITNSFSDKLGKGGYGTTREERGV